MCQYCRLTFGRVDGKLETKLLSVIKGLSRFICPRAQWMFYFSTVLGKPTLGNRWQQNCALATHWNRFSVTGPFVGSYFVVAPGRCPSWLQKFKCKTASKNCLSSKVSDRSSTEQLQAGSPDHIAAQRSSFWWPEQAGDPGKVFTQVPKLCKSCYFSSHPAPHSSALCWGELQVCAWAY